MYGQTVIHYKAATSTAFTAIIATTATTATKATTATTATIATMATTATGLSTDPPVVVTPVMAPSVAVSISLKKSLKHRPIDGMTWHLRCGHLGKEALENMVKRATKDEIEAPTTL